MALSGIVSFFNLKNLEISIIVSQDVFAMTPVNLKIKVKNRYFFDSFLIRLSIMNSELIIPHIKNGKAFYLKLNFPKRGKHLINEVFISSYFPFYFFKRTIKLPLNEEIIVFPYPLKSDFSFLLTEGKKQTDSTISKGKAYEGELAGVRDYTGEEPLKYIHWKATAKTSEPKTKDFSPPTGKPVILKLDDFSGSLEEKISKTTYALLSFSKTGSPVGLKLDDKIYKPQTGQAHLRRMLYALALYNKD